MTTLDVARLSSAELVQELKVLARQHSSEYSLQKAVNRRLPGIAVTVVYCGPMHSGMAMSHHHPGTLSF